MSANRVISLVFKGISCLLTLTALYFLATTGARLWWLDRINVTGFSADILDKLGATGRVTALHLYAGLLILLIALFYFCYTLLIRRGMLFGGAAERFPFISASAQLVLILSMTFALLSGIALYMGWYHTQDSYNILLNLHRVSGLVLVPIFIIALILLRAKPRESAYALTGRISRRIAFLVSCLPLLAVLLVLDHWKTPILESVRGDRVAQIDGFASPFEWHNAPELAVPCTGGAHFAGGTSWVRIRSFYDRQFIYFLFQWTDSTRSRNRRIKKTADGWIVLKNDLPDPIGERQYSEDQLAVSLSSSELGCLKSCHVSSGSGIGAHYTTADTMDLWIWRAQSTDPVGQADDAWWGSRDSNGADGLHLDNSPAGGYFVNFNSDWDQPYFIPDVPILYPWIDLRLNKMTPYFVEDDTLAVGTVLPGVLVSPVMGDRGNVRAAGHWDKGVWTLELARARVTGSPADIRLNQPVYLNVALFDNTDNAHAICLRPIRLIPR